MKCSNCKLEGHNKRSCKKNAVSSQNDTNQPKKVGLISQEIKNVTVSAYCKCGRKNEEGSFGCTRWPGCVNNSNDNDDWY
jgi:hypothetical protein